LANRQRPALSCFFPMRAPSCLSSRKLFPRVNASSFGPKGILSIADRGTTWMEHPVDFVSACSAATVDGLGLCAALWFGNHDTEVSAAPGEDLAKSVGAPACRYRPSSIGAFRRAAASLAFGASVDARWNIVKTKQRLRYFQITHARRGPPRPSI